MIGTASNNGDDPQGVVPGGLMHYVTKIYDAQTRSHNGTSISFITGDTLCGLNERLLMLNTPGPDCKVCKRIRGRRSAEINQTKKKEHHAQEITRTVEEPAGSGLGFFLPDASIWI